MQKPLAVLFSLGLILAFLLPGAAHFTSVQKTPDTPLAQPPAEAVPGLDLDFGNMPLYFVENQGQVDEQVAYYIQGRDKTLYFTSSGVTFALTSPITQTLNVEPPYERKAHSLITNQKSAISNQRWSVKLDFVGANPEARPAGQEQTEAIISYFKGRPEEWQTGLPTYQRILYADLWPGIDLAYFGTSDRLKYEFIVHPGADPKDIRLAYRGATTVSLTPAGELQVTTPVGGFSDEAPLAYQEINGRRVVVDVSYDLTGDSGQWTVGTHGPSGLRPLGNQHSPLLNQQSTINLRPLGRKAVGNPQSYTFSLAPYDPSLPLVIDPAVLVYSGYIGGGGDDIGFGITVDETGNAYITGWTNSYETDFPVTVGPDLTANDGGDAFVAKVNADGTGLVYAGYIGGSNDDEGHGISVDGTGNAYITGVTSSSEASFPVTVGPDLTYNGGGHYLKDAFVARVNAGGTELDYAGYIGGSSDDQGSDIAVDETGSAYVTGWTYSTEASFPVSIGPDLNHNGSEDAFVARVSADGLGLVYAGYIGGTNVEWGDSIAIDEAGNAYITGRTGSSEASFPVALGPDLTFNGDYDAFVAKVNASGTELVYAGYIGGSGLDEGVGIAIDTAGNAYVAGTTISDQNTFPVTGGPDPTFNGDADAFVASVNASGTGLVYAGYIGGSSLDLCFDIAIDGKGNTYITGYTLSDEDSFLMSGGPDLTYNGTEDAFVAKVNAGGMGLAYSGYIGGDSYDWGFSISIDRAGNAYITGRSESAEDSFPITGGPGLIYNWNGDAFVTKVHHELTQLLLPMIAR